MTNKTGNPARQVIVLASELIDTAAESELSLNEAMLALLSAAVFGAADALRQADSSAELEFNRHEIASVLDRTAAFIRTWEPDRDVRTLSDALRECLPILH
jgi:hypothetical protein